MSTDDSMPLPGTALSLLTAADLQDSLMVAGNDLDRLQRLLADASQTLLGHFYGVTDRLRQLRRATSHDAANPGADLEAAMSHMGGAITAMQFQDMASQLIAHTSQRLRSCTDRLAREVMGDDDEGTAVVEQPPLRPNPVTQDEMDAGSIELF
jgi:hypothetical protein